MRFSLIILVFISISLFSCSDGKIQSGEIEYEITYPYNKLSKIMKMMLPKKMTVVIKGNKMITTIKKGNIFTTNIVSNGTLKELEMRLKMGSDIYNAHLKTKDINELIASQPHYDFSQAESNDSLIGCLCVHYDVDCKNDTLPAFESVFTSDFAIQNATWFSSYKTIDGMPLEYLIDRYGLIMQVRVTSFTMRDVEDSEFEPKFDYKEVSYKKYDKKVQDLFDVMLD